jgi:hypothetical protein
MSTVTGGVKVAAPGKVPLAGDRAVNLLALSAARGKARRLASPPRFP